MPVITGNAFGFIVTACDVVPVHPPAPVTVTVYVPGVVGLILEVDAPLLHW